MNIADIKVGYVYKIKAPHMLTPHGLLDLKGDITLVSVFKSRFATWSDINKKEICVIGYQAGYIAAYLTDFVGVSFLIDPKYIDEEIRPMLQKTTTVCNCPIKTLVIKGCVCGAFDAEQGAA